jgi:hypothetical protein
MEVYTYYAYETGAPLRLLCGVQILERNLLIEKAVIKRRSKAKKFKKAIARIAMLKFDEYVAPLI